jgi:hypothetical protein
VVGSEVANYPASGGLDGTASGHRHIQELAVIGRAAERAAVNVAVRGAVFYCGVFCSVGKIAYCCLVTIFLFKQRRQVKDVVGNGNGILRIGVRASDVSVGIVSPTVTFVEPPKTVAEDYVNNSKDRVGDKLILSFISYSKRTG